jgi:hypothetical protein
MSLIIRENPQLGDSYYLHVDVHDREAGFIPETVEIIDQTSHQTVSDPFPLAEKDSQLCGKKVYETEGIDPTHMPAGYWERHAEEPYYIYRVTLRSVMGELRVVDVVGEYICKVDME